MWILCLAEDLQWNIEKNKTWCFMWILCLDDSHEISSIVFSKKTTKKHVCLSSAAVVIGAWLLGDSCVSFIMEFDFYAMIIYVPYSTSCAITICIELTCLGYFFTRHSLRTNINVAGVNNGKSNDKYKTMIKSKVRLIPYRFQLQHFSQIRSSIKRSIYFVNIKSRRLCDYLAQIRKHILWMAWF